MPAHQISPPGPGSLKPLHIGIPMLVSLASVAIFLSPLPPTSLQDNKGVQDTIVNLHMAMVLGQSLPGMPDALPVLPNSDPALPQSSSPTRACGRCSTARCSMARPATASSTTATCTKVGKYRNVNQKPHALHTGPTIVVVKDNENNIYVVAADEEWRERLGLWGKEDCRLYRVMPAFRLISSGGTQGLCASVRR